MRGSQSKHQISKITGTGLLLSRQLGLHSRRSEPNNKGL